MSESIGGAISTKKIEWYRIFERNQRQILGKPVIPKEFAIVPILYLTALVLAGMILLARRRAWLIVFIILGTVVLIWTTPWPAQFIRYLMPVGCFLSISAVLALAQLGNALRSRRANWVTVAGKLIFVGTFVLMFGAEFYTSFRFFHLRQDPEAIVVADGSKGHRLFAHERPWQEWEEAAAWLATHAPRSAIVATSAPHSLYLRTGLRTVFPPMNRDAVHARLLLENVPVSFVIIESWEFLDMSRRYAQPAMESVGSDWRILKAIGRTKIYQRVSDSP